MCGRFTVALSRNEIEEYLHRDFGIDEELDYPFPRYNIAPKQSIFGLVMKENKLEPSIFTWGFVPSFSKKDGKPLALINSRMESLEEKWFLKEAYHSRRCLLMADGFYEWEQTDQGKLPYRIHQKTGELFYFAGLYSKKRFENNQHTCSIITKAASKKMSFLHDRMPVMMDAKAALLYLQEGRLNEQVFLADDKLKMYPVSKLVNRVSVDQRECIEEEEPLRLNLL